jgi:hypothetical protein
MLTDWKCSCEHIPSTWSVLEQAINPPYVPSDRDIQPYLDSDMQSRWFDFGGNTIVRADQYAAQFLEQGMVC